MIRLLNAKRPVCHAGISIGGGMPDVDPAVLHRLACDLLCAVGTEPAEQPGSSPIPSSTPIWPDTTRTVCCACRLPAGARQGHVVPAAVASLISQSGATAIVDAATAGVSPRCGWRRALRSTARASMASAPRSSAAAITSVASPRTSSRSPARA